MRIRKKAAVLFVILAICAACPALAMWMGSNKGTWPKDWSEKLEPLRKQSQSWSHAMWGIEHDQIPFTKQEEFESVWPEILKVKQKGAPIVLVRGPHQDVGTPINAGVIIQSPPLSETQDRSTPAVPLPGFADNELTRWSKTTFIMLVVDGHIVDLNRISLPADTPIIDQRFSNGHDK